MPMTGARIAATGIRLTYLQWVRTCPQWTYLNSAMRQEQFWCQRDTGLDVPQGHRCRKPLRVNHRPLLQCKVGIGKDDRDVSRDSAVIRSRAHHDLARLVVNSDHAAAPL